MREPESAVIRWCEHGEDVRAGQSSRGCSGCVAGICGAALACWLPDADPEPPKRSRRFLPATREGWGRLIGAALGLASFPLLGREFLRHLFNLT